MEAPVLLCDFAEAVNGKLYVMGGGWNMLFAPNHPVNVTVAVVLAVGWDEANRRHPLAVALLDHDGNQVEIAGHAVAVGSEFEVGRPPGLSREHRSTRHWCSTSMGWCYPRAATSSK